MMEYHRKLGERMEVSFPNALLSIGGFVDHHKDSFFLYGMGLLSVSYMSMLCENIPLVLAITTLLMTTSVLSIKNTDTELCLSHPFHKNVLCQLHVLM